MKRRLSDSASASDSPSTPVPGAALSAAAALLPDPVPSSTPGSAAGSARVSPDIPNERRDGTHEDDDRERTGTADRDTDRDRDRASRRPTSTTPAPGARKEERTVAKLGVIVPGSGDGGAYGDECFLWTDLPMNKTGKTTTVPVPF